MGQVLQVLSGVSDGSWPLPAPTPWETAGIQWQGGRHSLFGALPGGYSFIWVFSPSELQTTWHTLLLPEQTAEEETCRH